MTPQLVLAASPAPPAHIGGTGSGYKWYWRLKGTEQTSSTQHPGAELADTMRTLSLLTLLALAAFCLSGPAGAFPSCSFLGVTVLLKGCQKAELTAYSFLYRCKAQGLRV